MKLSAKKASTTALCVLLTLCMSPMQALAATSVNVEGAGYTAKANGSGSNGGTWAWDGEDGMALDGYDGGAITAVGDLDIALSGDNTVTASAVAPSLGSAVYVKDGDLTITGDGTLDAESSTAVVSEVIVAYNGDVSIEGTTVTVDATSDSGSYGISSFGGDVNITGSDVDVTCNKPGHKNGWNIGILSSTASKGKGGQVNITSSDVSVTCSGDALANHGIMAGNEISSDPAPSVNIVDSNVSASAPGGAISASGWDTTCKKGTVTVTGSTITAPEGASVLDLQGVNYYENGQVIGTGTGPLTYLFLYDVDSSLNPAIATNVTIEKPAAPAPTPAQPADATVVQTTTGAEVASSLPKTGDSTLPATLALCSLLAAGGALLLARRHLAQE